jgi:dihydrodipicolinate reductase
MSGSIFHSPRARSGLIRFLRGAGRLPALVIGTTGHTAAEQALIEELSRKTEILKASNFSTGVLALKKALEFISPALAQAGFRLMVETHHVHKKDASGTALTLAQATQGLAIERIHSIRPARSSETTALSSMAMASASCWSITRSSREFCAWCAEAALWLGRRRAAGNSGWRTLDDFFEERFACLK